MDQAIEEKLDRLIANHVADRLRGDKVADRLVKVENRVPCAFYLFIRAHRTC